MKMSCGLAALLHFMPLLCVVKGISIDSVALAEMETVALEGGCCYNYYDEHKCPCHSEGGKLPSECSKVVDGHGPGTWLAEGEHNVNCTGRAVAAKTDTTPAPYWTHAVEDLHLNKKCEGAVPYCQDSPTSEGSCYDSSADPNSGHAVVCNVNQQACTGTDPSRYSWYPPGYASLDRDGHRTCCHCNADCDHSLENPDLDCEHTVGYRDVTTPTCNRVDGVVDRNSMDYGLGRKKCAIPQNAKDGCYPKSEQERQCDCAHEGATESTCAAPKQWMTGTCTSCVGSDKVMSPSGVDLSTSGCYDTTTHQCSCIQDGATETNCVGDTKTWSTACNSCARNSDPSATAPGCYDTNTHVCSCPPDVSKSSCTEPNIWTEGCYSCASQQAPATAPGCYDTVEHVCSCPPAVSESSCTAPNVWTTECRSCASSSATIVADIVVEITFPGTLSALTETQKTEMKDAVKAALPVISGVTYSVELRSGSIIAKVTLTGAGASAVAAEQVKTTVTATPLSVTVSGQTFTSTGVVLVNVPINAASMALTLSCKYSTLGLVLMMLGLALS